MFSPALIAGQARDEARGNSCCCYVWEHKKQLLNGANQAHGLPVITIIAIICNNKEVFKIQAPGLIVVICVRC